MKQRLQIFLCLLLISSFIQAQNQFAPGAVDKLKLTSNPAYVILGVEPTNIERPSTPRDFISGVQAGVVNGKLSPNFAMEFNPFIWGKHLDTIDPHYKWFKAADYIADPNWGHNFTKAFGLSLATSQTDSTVYGSLKPGTGLSFGVTMNLYSTPNRQITRAYHSWAINWIKASFYQYLVTKQAGSTAYTFTATDIVEAQNFAQQATNSQSIRIEIRAELLSIVNDLFTDISQKSLTNFIDSANKYQAALDIPLRTINHQNIAYAKTGFSLDLAAAGATAFPDNNWSNVVFSKAGVWLTPSYRWNVSNSTAHTQSIDWLAVARLTWNDKRVDSANFYFDFGTKIQYSYDKLSIAAEGILRYAQPTPQGQHSPWTYRAVANIEYTLVENITIKVTLGTNFDGNSRTYTNPKQMVAIAGLNFGLLK